MYPSHVVRMKAVTPGEQSNDSLVHIASKMLHVKKGTQQIKNTPATFTHCTVTTRTHTHTHSLVLSDDSFWTGSPLKLTSKQRHVPENIYV
jgi:hypothetical protein